MNERGGNRDLERADTVASDTARPPWGAPTPDIPGYELQRVVGRGGMGTVYLARQADPERTVALKVLIPQGEDQTDELARFRTESAAFARLDHPNIVPIYEVGESGDHHYFTMRYLEQGSLDGVLRSNLLPSRRIAEIMCGITRGIAHAHRRGFLHRDLKPANILMDADGNGLVTDFGLAKRIESTDGPTRTGQIMGTPSYMAPEQAAGRVRDQTVSTDVYSLGAILYEMLAGVPPFHGENTMQVLLDVLERNPPRPSILRSGVDPSLQIIAMKCLRKDPAERYPSADHLLEDLEAYLKGEEILAGHRTGTEFMRYLLRQTRHTEIMGRWGEVFLWTGRIILIHFVIIQLAQVPGSSIAWLDPGIAFLSLGAVMFVLWKQRLRVATPFDPIERQMIQIIVGTLVCLAIHIVLMLRAGVPVQQGLPHGILLMTLQFLALAAILGGSFYPAAGGTLCLSLSALLTGGVEPWMAGSVLGLGMLVPGYRFRAADASGVPPATPGSDTSTTTLDASPPRSEPSPPNLDPSSRPGEPDQTGRP